MCHVLNCGEDSRTRTATYASRGSLSELLLPNEERQKVPAKGYGVSHFAFPHDLDAPAEVGEGCIVSCVSGPRAGELRTPVLCSAFGHVANFACVMVPKAAVDENDGPMLWQDDVWVAGQITPMHPEPKTQSVQQGPHPKLRPCVGTLDACHQLPPFVTC